MSVDWLQDLEEKVHEAAEKIAELRKENEELRSKLAEAEEKGSSGEAGWEKEREEIQGRVSKLAEHLEKLLDD